MDKISKIPLSCTPPQSEQRPIPPRYSAITQLEAWFKAANLLYAAYTAHWTQWDGYIIEFWHGVSVISSYMELGPDGLKLASFFDLFFLRLTLRDTPPVH